MDEDKKNVSYSLVQSRWLNEISLIAIAGAFSANLSPLSADPSATTKPRKATSTYSWNPYGGQKRFHPSKIPSVKDAQNTAQTTIRPAVPAQKPVKQAIPTQKLVKPAVPVQKSVKPVVPTQKPVRSAVSAPANPNVEPTMNPPASIKQVPKEFPIIKPMDAASAQSRNQYSTQKVCCALENLKKSLAKEDAHDTAHKLVIFAIKFTVHNADLIYRQALQAKMVEKPTAKQVCLELLNVVLEQTLPFAKNWGCFEEFTKTLSESYGPSFDIFKKEFQETTHLSKNRPDDGSGISTDFSHEYAQMMEEKACAVVRGYSNLFTIKNCPEEIATLLAEYAEEIKESMANAKKNLGTSQSAATLNRTNDELARFIVSKADAIAQKFPEEKIDKIHRALTMTALPFILPAISQMGSLWTFSNGFKNGGIPSLRKTFETKFRLHGEFIVNQGSPLLEEEPEVDQNKLTETEKRAAARRKQEEKDRREAAAQKYIATQIDIIIEWLCEITRRYLDIFQKRDTPNWPI
jgi:hypothetical protein